MNLQRQGWPAFLIVATGYVWVAIQIPLGEWSLAFYASAAGLITAGIGAGLHNTTTQRVGVSFAALGALYTGWLIVQFPTLIDGWALGLIAIGLTGFAASLFFKETIGHVLSHSIGLAALGAFVYLVHDLIRDIGASIPPDALWSIGFTWIWFRNAFKQSG